MQFFRHLSLRWTGRALGLFLAYVLVVQSLLVPLRAFAAALPDRDGAVIVCQPDGMSAAGVKIFDDFGQSHNGQMHHDCEVGCFTQGGNTLDNFSSAYFTLLKLKTNFYSIPIEKSFILSGNSSSILARGKAPGAPPSFIRI